jgi:hypothetical protein
MQILRRWLLACLVAGMAAPASAQDVTTGLIGHWKLNETSGTSAVDSSSFGNNGTYQNGVALASSTPVPVDGAVAATFDGNNDYVSVPNEANFDVTGSLTVAVWLKVTAFDATWQAIVTKGDSAWRLSRNGDTNTIHFAIGSGGTIRIADSVTGVNDGQWHHVVGVYDGSTAKVYIDGNLDVTVAATGAIATNNHPVELGRNAEQAGREWYGSLYDARVYNRALTAADVAALYSVDQVVGEWPLDDGAGSTVADLSPNGNDGTALNGPIWVTRCDGRSVLSLDGVNDYVSIPADAALDVSGDATLSGWFCLYDTFDNTATNSVVIAEKFNHNDENLHVALVGVNYTNGSPPTGSLVFKLNGATAAYRYTWTNQTTWQAGVWYHFAITIDADTPANNRVLVNGIDDTMGSTGTSAFNDLSFSAPINIGGKISENIPGESYLHAEIADFKLYNYQLLPEDIAYLFGLVGHWKLDETTGMTAVDSSLLANNATYQGSPTLGVAGAVDSAVQFDGANYAITNQTFNPPSIGTVAFWMQRAGAPAARERFFGVGGDWEIWQDPDGVIRCDLGGDGNVGGFFSVTSMVTPSQWYHIAATFDAVADTYEIFINGVSDKSGSMALSPQASAQLSIAARTGLSVERFQGILDDLRIYNRILCPSDIQQLYNEGSGVSQGVRIISWTEVP